MTRRPGRSLSVNREPLRGLGRYRLFISVQNRRWLIAYTTLAVLSVVPSTAHANLDIIPVFLSSITASPDAGRIEDTIDSAVSVFHNLYGNNLTITTDFSYTPSGAADLLTTTQNYYDISYTAYVNALKADSAVHPQNIVLTIALDNLSHGNDANGDSDMALAGGQMAMLGLGPGSDSNATININSDQSFAFIRPVPNSQYDLIGGLEHELDEVLGAAAGDRLSTRLHHPARTTRVTSFATRLARWTFTATPLLEPRAFRLRARPAPTFPLMAARRTSSPLTRILRETSATSHRPGQGLGS
jgi:hypothetical protein